MPSKTAIVIGVGLAAAAGVYLWRKGRAQLDAGGAAQASPLEAIKVGIVDTVRTVSKPEERTVPFTSPASSPSSVGSDPRLSSFAPNREQFAASDVVGWQFVPTSPRDLRAQGIY